MHKNWSGLSSHLGFPALQGSTCKAQVFHKRRGEKWREAFTWKKEWVRGNPTQKNAQRRAQHNFPLPYITYRQETLSQWRAAHPHSQKCFVGLRFDHKPKTRFRVEKLSAVLGQYTLLWKWFCMFSIWNHTNIASFPVWLWNFEQLHSSSSLLSLTCVLTPPDCFSSIFTYFNPTFPPISSIFISQCLWTLPLFSTAWVSTLEMSQLLQAWLLNSLVRGCSRPHRTLSFTSVSDQLCHYPQTTSLGPNSTQICPFCFLRRPQPCLRLSHINLSLSVPLLALPDCCFMHPSRG